MKKKGMKGESLKKKITNRKKKRQRHQSTEECERMWDRNEETENISINNSNNNINVGQANTNLIIYDDINLSH